MTFHTRLDSENVQTSLVVSATVGSGEILCTLVKPPTPSLGLVSVPTVSIHGQISLNGPHVPNQQPKSKAGGGTSISEDLTCTAIRKYSVTASTLPHRHRL